MHFFARVNAELFLGESLGRQPMTIPAPDTLDALAFHRLVARYGVFDDTTQQRPVVRDTRDKRRPVVKHIRIILRALLDRFFKCLVLLPLLHPVFFVFERSAACS